LERAVEQRWVCSAPREWIVFVRWQREGHLRRSWPRSGGTPGAAVDPMSTDLRTARATLAGGHHGRVIISRPNWSAPSSPA
jgi:hypothetical protein